MTTVTESLTVEDAFPLDNTETTDTDSDGIGNNADTDDDGDGVIDSEDAFPSVIMLTQMMMVKSLRQPILTLTVLVIMLTQMMMVMESLTVIRQYGDHISIRYGVIDGDDHWIRRL